MSDRELRADIPGGIQKVNFDGFISAWVVAHEDGSLRIGVYIPRLMPDVPPMQKATYYTKDDEIPIDDGIIANEEKLLLSKKIKKCNYIWINPLFWARKSYKAIHSKIDDEPRRSRKVAAVATPMLDPSTPSKQVEPHRKDDMIRSSTGNVVISGNVDIHGGVTEVDHTAGNPPETYTATMSNILAAEETADRLNIGGVMDRGQLAQNVSNYNRTHKWEEPIDQVWDVPQPQIGENVIVIFLDGDIQKGYYLPFSP